MLLSLSPRVDPATTEQPLTGLDYQLSVTTFSSVQSPNGEMRLADVDVPFTHQGFFVMTDPVLVDTFLLAFAVDVPEQGDQNGNGITDFFDPASGTEGITTAGIHSTFDNGGADFEATWTRAAGAASGTVALNLPELGLTFTHAYHLVHYAGEFSFQRVDRLLEGTVALTNALAPEEVLSGPLSLTITNDATLGYSPGTWTNSLAETYRFEPVDALDRVGTNYLSILFFEDGFSSTSDPDYNYWFFTALSADTNGNGILDLVETGGEPPLDARLEINKTEEGILITIKGIAGTSYVLEEADSVAGNWSEAQTITLDAGGNQAVALTHGAGRKFFRVRRTP